MTAKGFVVKLIILVIITKVVILVVQYVLALMLAIVKFRNVKTAVMILVNLLANFIKV